MGLFSLSGKTSYRTISWSPEATRFLGLDFYNRQQGCRDAIRIFERYNIITIPNLAASKTSYRLVNKGFEVNDASLPVKWTEFDFVRISPYRGMAGTWVTVISENEGYISSKQTERCLSYIYDQNNPKFRRQLMTKSISWLLKQCLPMPISLTWIRIGNYMPGKVWGEVMNPFPNFNGLTVEVWEWMRDFFLIFIMHVITYLY